MTTERTKPITIKTDADAIAYLKTRGRDIEADPTFALDKNGNAFVIREHVCGRCGGTGGGHWYQDGGICYECNGKNSRYKYSASVVGIAKKERALELRIKAKERKATRKREAFEARVDAAATEFDANFPGFRAKLAPYLEGAGGAAAQKKHNILNDLADKLAKWGSLSEKQVAFAEKLLDEAAAPKTALEGGRRELTGKVLSVKWRDSNYGGAFKMTVALDNGGRVWGTVPSALEDAARDYYQTHVKTNTTFHLDEVLKGATITFTATVNVSDDDESFGFFKRPTSPVLAGVAWVAPEVDDVRCDFCDGRHATNECPGEAYEAARSDDR